MLTGGAISEIAPLVILAMTSDGVSSTRVELICGAIFKIAPQAVAALIETAPIAQASGTICGANSTLAPQTACIVITLAPVFARSSTRFVATAAVSARNSREVVTQRPNSIKTIAMTRPKLGFRNRSALEQLTICDRVIANLARAPREHVMDVRLETTITAIAAARTSHEQLMQLKAEVKTVTRQRNELLREARRWTTLAQKGHLGRIGLHPGRMRAAGMELENSKRRSVGQPAKVTNLSAVPETHSTMVTLRWDRSVRRCAFEIQTRLDGQPESEWKHDHVCLKQRCDIKRLKSGGLYWFRVRASNAHGAGPWSNPVSARVR